MASQTDKPREAALLVLKEVNHDGKYANISLKAQLKSFQLKGRDAAFVTQLVYGTLERQITIDWVIRKFATLKRVNPWVENILRMGCCQILYMDRVPDSAACNEAVKLVKKFGPNALQGFVNGILRNISRNKGDIKLPEREENLLEHLALTYSYPAWLVEKWIKDYGEETARMILEPQPQGDVTTIRVSAQKTNYEEMKKSLEDHGILCQPGLYMREAVRLQHMQDVENNPLYQQGYFTVQGESSMLVTHILDPQRGEMILDACSAPGGKALHTADRMGMSGKVEAWDFYPHRVDLINWNAERMGASILKARVQDSRIPVTGLKGKMDRVLLDVPCSGWGVIHKKPDIKLKASGKELEDLRRTQQSILETCCRYVKSGGILVYSTCTINPDENQKMIEWFLKGHPDFQLDDFTHLLPEELKRWVSPMGMIQLIPFRDGVDGFFICRMRKKEK